MQKFAIVYPVYNTAGYLDESLNSILNQTYSNFEIFCVDDGSTDGTAELCRRLSEQYANVTALRKENGGPSSARNLGLRAAKGE